MVTIGEIYEALDEWAPFSTQEGFDNSGILIGGQDQPVFRCLLALDLTRAVCQEASERQVQLVITHHPVIFDPLKRLPPENVVYQAVQAGIGIISAHTNLDRAPGGVSDTLADVLGLTHAEDLEGGEGFVKIGEIPNVDMADKLANRVKERLRIPNLRLLDSGHAIRRIAICSGAGGSYLGEVIAGGADAYITGDIKHNQVVEAANAGLTLIDAGHYETETIILDAVGEYLQERFPDTAFCRAERDNPLFQVV